MGDHAGDHDEHGAEGGGGNEEGEIKIEGHKGKLI